MQTSLQRSLMSQSAVMGLVPYCIMLSFGQLLHMGDMSEKLRFLASQSFALQHVPPQQVGNSYFRFLHWASY